MEKPRTQRQIGIYRNRVMTVISEQKFVLNEDDLKVIEKKVLQGKRYFFIVLNRNENGKIVSRFLKIPKNNSKLLMDPFTRQIRFSIYIKENTSLKTRGVVEYNYNIKKGVPFVIMETFPKENSKIGFIEGNNNTENLGEKEARSVMTSLQVIHDIDYKTLPKELKKALKVKTLGEGYDYIVKTVRGSLNIRVLPLDAKNNKKEPLHLVLERRLGEVDFKKRVINLLKKIEPIIDTKENQGFFIVHGDMAPNNLYVYDNGDVELLDFEWFGRFKNRSVAMVYDFGNFRARSWRNKAFRDSLDKTLLEIYKKRNQERLGQAIICLSILRAIVFSGFFENYKWEKQSTEIETERRRLTENEIKKIWEFNF
ncbi:MAG: hypothetical protein AB198_02650 [Parcubacteria bacterium C7867-003]|nr:MAG: hypothetical protein AB198_02650 [Parcubacteria bacterium C7867-003]